MAQFDFDGWQRSDGIYGMISIQIEVAPAAVILLDGAYSCGPQLADLVDLTVLVGLPEVERRARQVACEAPGFLELWNARWDAAEDLYFTTVRPPESFDLVVTMTEGAS